jgi:hypothetical protein
MMPYRAAQAAPVAPPVNDLTFRRRNVGLFTAPVIGIAAMVLLLPLPLFALPQGRVFFLGGGWGMFLLVAMALFVAVGCAMAGSFAVRGNRAGAAVVAGVPLLPAVFGALLGAVGLNRAFGAIAAIEGDGDLRMRIMAAGLGESDALPAYGCLLSAIACGASACALLGNAATVDRKPHNAPAGRAWAAPLAIGGLGFIVAVTLRLALRIGGMTLLFSVPSILIVTGLACAAALNGPLVRDWREPREADRWVVSVFASALLAGAGLVLLELGAAYLSESTGLGAISGESLDPSQRARILAEVASEQSSYRVLAAVDALFVVVVILTVAFAGLGRGANGKLRIPGGAALYVALGATALVIASMVGTRSWQMGRIEQAPYVSAAGEARQLIDLPRVPLSPRLTSSSRSGAVLRVDAKGKKTFRAAEGLEDASSLLVVEADRRAEWGDVARAIRETRQAHASGHSRTRPMTIELRVTLLEKADRSQLGPYGVLLGDETSTLVVALASQEYSEDDDDSGFRHVAGAYRPRSFEIMDAIAASIARRPQRLGGLPSSPDVAILPPEGNW